MTQITDFSTDVAKVRLLISDVDDTDQIFADEAIQAAVDFVEGNLYVAAAQLLRTIAINEVLVQKVIRIGDLSTNGAAQAKELRELADTYQERGESDEAGFTWAETILTPAQWDEARWRGRRWD